MSVIAATGCFIAPVRVANADFIGNDFREADGREFGKPNPQILEQFEAITGIRERRYISEDMVTSDMATEAARNALDSSEIDRESLDAILVAHNFGDVRPGSSRGEQVPSLAARVKHKLGIRRPSTAAWDLIFGCPGWLQGVIVADGMIRAGDAKRVMVIGAESLSRVSDPHDRDSLIYADGAGATILEAADTDDAGFLSHGTRSDTGEHLDMLFMARSNRPDLLGDELYLKMEGRKLYRYALQTVAGAIHDCLDRAGVALAQVRKVLLHQANEKMDEAILAAVFDQADIPAPADIMPMTIGTLGNSSVATIPTMLDLILRGQLPPHRIESGDTIVFASVGAGMHINAAVYRQP